MTQKQIGRTHRSGTMACHAVQQDACVSIARSGAHDPGAKNGSVACCDLNLLENGAMTLGHCRCLALVMLREGGAHRMESPFDRHDACDGADGQPEGGDARGPQQAFVQQSHTRMNTLEMAR